MCQNEILRIVYIRQVKGRLKNLKGGRKVDFNCLLNGMLSEDNSSGLKKSCGCFGNIFAWIIFLIILCWCSRSGGYNNCIGSNGCDYICYRRCRRRRRRHHREYYEGHNFDDNSCCNGWFIFIIIILGILCSNKQNDCGGCCSNNILNVDDNCITTEE